MSNPFDLLAKKLRHYGSDPSEAQLIEAARELLSVCENQKASLRSFTAAKHGEERLYELAVILESDVTQSPLIGSSDEKS